MTNDRHECDLMCERLAAYLEDDLTPAEQAEADRHLMECASCRETLAELRAIAAGASSMPLLTPSRDLWSGIESRISTPVTALGGASAVVRRAPPRQWQYAMAAAALIAVTAGTTYFFVTRSGTVAPQVAARTAAPARNSAVATPAPLVIATPTPPANATVASYRSKKELSAARVYDNEITLLDSLVRTRRTSLDPKTVTVIENNLQIINKAILESRAALAKDPKSPMLSNQLDNVLGSKVELLRTVAFLPTQS